MAINDDMNNRVSGQPSGVIKQPEKDQGHSHDTREHL